MSSSNFSLSASVTVPESFWKTTMAGMLSESLNLLCHSLTSVLCALAGKNPAWSLVETSEILPNVGPPSPAIANHTTTKTVGSKIRSQSFGVQSFMCFPLRIRSTQAMELWGRLRELNPRPILYEGIALPTELRRREPQDAEQLSSLVVRYFACELRRRRKDTSTNTPARTTAPAALKPSTS